MLQRLGENTVLECVVENALRFVEAKDLYVVVGTRRMKSRHTSAKPIPTSVRMRRPALVMRCCNSRRR